MPKRLLPLLLFLALPCRAYFAQADVVPDVGSFRGSFSEAPAEKWEDGMVAGNGLVGTLHYGPPQRPAMVFNSHQFIVPNGAPFPVPNMSDRLEALRDGRLAGVKGRSQFTVDELTWDTTQRTIRCTLTSDIAQTLTVRHRNGVKKLKTAIEHAPVADNAANLTVPAGKPVVIMIEY